MRPRRIVSTAVVAAALFGGLVAPSGAAGSKNPAFGVWYPHDIGSCSATDQVTLNRKHIEGQDNDGCGQINGAGTISGVSFVWTATKAEALKTDLPNGLAVTTVFYIATNEPEPGLQYTVNLAGQIPGQTTLITIGSGTSDSVNSLGVAGPYYKLTAHFHTTKGLRKGDLLSLSITTNSSLTSFIGYAKTHVSKFTIG